MAVVGVLARLCQFRADISVWRAAHLADLALATWEIVLGPFPAFTHSSNLHHRRDPTCSLSYTPLLLPFLCELKSKLE
jgi:hypothetical protein